MAGTGRRSPRVGMEDEELATVVAPLVEGTTEEAGLQSRSLRLRACSARGLIAAVASVTLVAGVAGALLMLLLPHPEPGGDSSMAAIGEVAVPAPIVLAEEHSNGAAHIPVPVGGLPPWALGGEIGKQMIQEEMAYHPLSSAKTEARFWKAPIDHFPPLGESSGTFDQKFYVSDQFYKDGGPVFFELGGEGGIGGPPGGFIAALARERKALLVQVEHRFYGDSVPNGNVNASNLRYLTVRQALADYAAFIDWYSAEAKLPEGTKWFAFGGSYPGALASWFRIAYPDKTVGSLSSSGVVNSIFDFVMFDVHIERAIGAECADAHRAITSAFETSVLARGEEERHAKELFGCKAEMLDGDFFYMLADGLAMMVQYGRKSLLCSNITGLDYDKASSEEIMSNTASLIKHFWGTDFGSGCFYDTSCLKDPARYEVGGTDRSWRWQKCYELAYLQPAPLPDQQKDGTLLPKPLRSWMVNMSYMVDQCYAVFGDFNAVPGGIDFSTQAINAQYGGAQPTARKVFYSNFADDPWLEASVMPPRDIDDEQPYEVALCEDCGHCMDLHTPNADKDPAALKAVRARFEKYMDDWLDE
mmetsp:Transcript_102181/g.256140  ORF Transcript_102181/g.256140 Transcript_102181/m.256140 type:complete len:587 (+) Transcript_102181:139-1899(+)|eukprot:CAMPEP_0115267254 /NCGR_PEP_ID=MMETSP0270-20121206/51895_1 /TAXON_ID=71861 /ORGANISM="Scrippsiella trochoidea, Strain CCMP3099" /LENGTH=586 /DNA_ID=CAMNT_0002683389 /DNA_START=47 /DNA_END=1807 /DNA_ORIENTATION=+